MKKKFNYGLDSHYNMKRVKWSLTVLAYFGPGQKEAITYYEKFVQDGIALGRRPELVGGSLVRSVGDWFQVLSLRRKGIRKVSKACQGK